MTSRGCAYSCSYCCHSYLKKIYKNKGKYLRQRGIDNIIKELSIAKEKYDLRLVRFWDDDFIVNRDIHWFKEFSHKYKNNINLPFICNLYPRNVSGEIIKYLKDSGCCELDIGVQSWDDELRRKILFRNTSNLEIERIIDMINRDRINLTLDFMCGIPSQTDEDAISFLKFCGRKKVGDINFNGIRYFPSVDLTLDMEAGGYFSPAKNKDIIDGGKSRLLHFGGDIPAKVIIKFKTAVLLLKAFPNNIAEYLIKIKFYRLIEKLLPQTVINKVYNLCMHSYDRDYISRRQHRNQIHFIKKTLLFIK
jgi:hypothetical protein